MYAACSTLHAAGVSDEMPNCAGASKYGDAGPEWWSGLKLLSEDELELRAYALPTPERMTRVVRSVVVTEAMAEPGSKVRVGW